MTSFNRETLIFLGIAVLLINIVVSAALRRKFKVVNAIVAIVAGAMVIVGIAQVTLLPTAATPAAVRADISVSSNASNPGTAPTNISFGNGRANAASQSAADQTTGTTSTTGSA